MSYSISFATLAGAPISRIQSAFLLRTSETNLAGGSGPNLFFASLSHQVYKTKIHRNYVGGADFTTGQFTHTVRFSVLHLENNIGDAVLGSSLPLANLGLDRASA